MKQSDRDALELRAAEARSRLERHLRSLERHGRDALRTAERAATGAAIVVAGLGGGLAALALGRAFVRPRRARARGSAWEAAVFAGAPWMLLALGFLYTSARRRSGQERAHARPLLPPQRAVQQTRLS